MSGEGEVFSLQHGIKKAGANSLLMSLWKVDDKPTEMLMTRYFSNLTDVMDKYKALRYAQRYVREYETPVYKIPEEDTGNEFLTEEQKIEKAGKELEEDEHSHQYQNPRYWATFILPDALD